MRASCRICDGDVQGGGVVVEGGALAADVEAQAFDHQPQVERLGDQVPGVAGLGAELGAHLDLRADIRDLQPQDHAGGVAMLFDLLELVLVVEGDERLVPPDLAERVPVLDRIGEDDPVPDVEVLVLLLEVPDVLVDLHELVVGGHVEACAFLEQRLDDFLVGVRLDGVVRLDAGQVLLERAVVGPDHLVVDDEQGRAVLLGQFERLFLHVVRCIPSNGLSR